MTPLLAIDLVQPMALLLAVPAMGLGAWLVLRARSRRQRLACVLRVLALLALVVALARPRQWTTVDDLAVAFVLDVSRSVPEPAREQALAWISSSLQKVAGNDQASLIVFAEKPAIEIPFTGVRGRGDAGLSLRLDNVETRISLVHSDLAEAVRFAEGASPPGFARRVVLLSDGNATRGDLDSAARALAASGVRLDAWPLRYRHESEVMVEGLHGPGRAHVGEPVQLRGVVSAQEPVDAEVALLQNGVPIAKQARVRLDRGANVLRWTASPGEAGWFQYEMIVTAPGDGQSANNSGRASLMIGGDASVTIVAPDEDDERLSESLRGSEVAVRRIRPAAAPRHPGGWLGAKAIVLHDTPAWILDDAQLEALRDAVRELGVGLVVIGGPHAYAPGGYRGTPIEELLPVHLDAQNRRSQPKGALVVVLHSIEFDMGNTWGAAICKAAIGALSDHDEAGVVYYDYAQSETWLFPLHVLNDRARLGRLIDQVQVGDMPSFHNCFVLAEAALSKSDAAAKHIIVVSDGDPQAPDSGLMRRLAQDRVTTTAICIQPHGTGNAEAMRDLAIAGGGRFHLIEDSGQIPTLPKVITKEASTLRRAAIVEKEFTPVIGLAGSPLLRGMPAAWPALRGYVVTSARAEAETILIADAEEKDPLLAAWYAGAGRVVAFTSDAASRWARDWLGWDQFQPFWARVVRSVMADRVSGGFPASATPDGPGLRIELNAIDPSGTPVTGLDVRGSILVEGRAPQTVTLEAVEPGRYLARAAIGEPGHVLVRLSYEHDGRRYESLAASAVDAAPEFRALQSNEAALARAAALTGGRVLGAADDPFVHDVGGASGRKELWPPLILAAALLVIADLLARRFDVRLPKLRRRRRALAPAAAGATPAVAKRPVPAAVSAEPEPEPDAPAPPPPKPKLPPPPDGGALDELKKGLRRAEERRRWR